MHQKSIKTQNHWNVIEGPDCAAIQSTMGFEQEVIPRSVLMHGMCLHCKPSIEKVSYQSLVFNPLDKKCEAHIHIQLPKL